MSCGRSFLEKTREEPLYFQHTIADEPGDLALARSGP